MHYTNNISLILWLASILIKYITKHCFWVSLHWCRLPAVSLLCYVTKQTSKVRTAVTSKVRVVMGPSLSLTTVSSRPFRSSRACSLCSFSSLYRKQSNNQTMWHFYCLKLTLRCLCSPTRASPALHSSPAPPPAVCSNPTWVAPAPVTAPDLDWEGETVLINTLSSFRKYGLVGGSKVAGWGLESHFLVMLTLLLKQKLTLSPDLWSLSGSSSLLALVLWAASSPQ